MTKISNLTIGDIMSTALITMKARDTVAAADLDMRLANIRHIPVVDDKEHLIGIVSNRDIARALGVRQKKSVVVSEVMATAVHTVAPDTPAREGVELMLEHKIGSLPVIGDQEQLVGIVTDTDFLEIARRALS